MAGPGVVRGATVLAAIGTLAHAPAPAAAETASAWTEVYNSHVRLIAGSRGAAIVAGFEIRMAEGWKTYWRNPGDSGGVPPHFDLAKSGNLMAARVLYPAPKRLPDSAGESIGYKGSVLFPMMLTPKDPAQPITLVIAAEFGICREICVPAETSVTLVVPPAPGASPALEAALSKVPVRAAAGTVAPALAAREAHLTGDKPRLAFEVAASGKEVDAFIEAPDGIYVPMPQKVGPLANGRQRFEIDLSSGVEPGDLKGKELTLTLVTETGASEVGWPVE